MQTIKKIEELHESSIALVDATDIKSIEKQENKGLTATVILSATTECARVMCAGNTVTQAALIATVLESNERLMHITLKMLMHNN